MEFYFRAFSVGAVDSDDLDAYLTPQRQKKNVRSIFGSVERGLNTVKQILTPKRTSGNKPRKTWVDLSFLKLFFIIKMFLFRKLQMSHQ